MCAFRLPSYLLIFAAVLWFAVEGVCIAEEVKFPDKSPLVSFTLPDGWIVDEDRGPDPSVLDGVYSATVKFRLRLLKDTYGDADFQQKMSSFFKVNAGTFGLDANSFDPTAIKVASRPLNDKIQAVCAEVQLKSVMLDEPCRLRIVGFTVNGKSMLAMCGMEESAQKAAQGSDKILASLKPTK